MPMMNVYEMSDDLCCLGMGDESGKTHIMWLGTSISITGEIKHMVQRSKGGL